VCCVVRHFFPCLLCLGAWAVCTSASADSGADSMSNSVSNAAAAVRTVGPLPAEGRSHERVGVTVADRPSAHYRFEKTYLHSTDGKRRYRIDIAIPTAPPVSAAGYGALYMLDGNAAIASLTDDDLIALSRRQPLVLVAIGYDIPTRNDVVSRAYDYTPPVYDARGQRIAEPVVRGRVGGGADAFLQFITTHVKPLARSRAAIDTRRESLWGHSYGGLFVLYTLLTQPQAFARYIAGDPSLWWHDGALLRQWQAFDKDRASGKHVALLVGAKPRDASRPPPPSQQSGTGSPASVNTRAVTQDMAETLHQYGAHAVWQVFPQYSHGDMLRASLEYALHAASAS